MSALKHTTGPWNIYFNSQDDVVVRKMFDSGFESHVIARVNSGFANALLIAAAPELLEALNEIVLAADGSGWSELDASFTKARAAIAKATGGAGGLRAGADEADR